MGSLRKLRTWHYTDEVERVGLFDAWPCYPKQRAWVTQTRRNSLFLGAIGAGKTRALVMKAILWSLIHGDGQVGALLARTGRDTLQTILPTFYELLAQYQEATGVPLLRNFVRSEMRADMEGGGSILFRPYGESVDRLRGLNLAWAGIDEIEYARNDPRYVWDVVSGRVRTGDPDTRAVFAATTPNGMRGIVAHFVEKQSQADPSHYVAHATIYDNPWLGDGRPCPDCNGDGCERCGDTGQASEFRDAVRQSSSKRYFEQDGLGRVLKPVAGVFGSYDTGRHIIDWDWDPDLPFVLAIDWGESVAVALMIQVVDRFDHEYPPGTWVVCEELILTQCSREQFRAALLKWVRRRGVPYWASADRACPGENRFLRYAMPKLKYFKVCESRKLQRINYGIGAIESMLDPAVGPPRLYLSSALPQGLGRDEHGLRNAMVNYRYALNALGELTDRPLKDGTTDHVVDALRYAVVTSAHHKALHGGQALPFVRLEEPSARRDFRYDEAFDAAARGNR